jgi:hypothetical protein
LAKIFERPCCVGSHTRPMRGEIWSVSDIRITPSMPLRATVS